MLNIKVLNGDLTLAEKALEILPYAIKFYGDRYEKIVLDTLRHTHFYMWNNEQRKEVIEKIIEKKVNIPNDDSVKGFYFPYDNLEKGYKHVVVVKNMDSVNKQKLILTHELFGHAVLSNINPFVKENDILYQRNGLAKVDYVDQIKRYNIIINEAVVEYIAEEIMKLYDPNFKSEFLTVLPIECASLARLLFDIIGKDKMLEVLVLNKGNMKSLFNPNNLKEWDILTEKLEQEKPYIGDHVLSFLRRNNRKINGKIV